MRQVLRLSNLHNFDSDIIIASMIGEAVRAWGAFRATRGDNPRSLALMEGSTNCNRACSYCSVHTKSGVDEASTLAETRTQIDWLWKQGFRVLNYVGGEPLAECLTKGEVISRRYHRCEYGVPACGYVESEEREENAFYRTKEGITFAEHTLRVVEYASSKGMLTNVTTNGDFLKSKNLSILGKLKKAGLDTLTFSLHSYNEAGLKNIIGKARAAAQKGIVPIVSVVFTADRTDTMPLYARTCAANGLLFSTSIVQEIGTGFSSVPSESQIPSIDQQRAVLRAYYL